MIAHVRATRRYRRELWAGSPLSRRRRKWRSWRRHPVSNLRYHFWAWMPHRPAWIMNDATFGAVDHEGWSDADGGWIWVECARCHMHRDSGA